MSMIQRKNPMRLLVILALLGTSSSALADDMLGAVPAPLRDSEKIVPLSDDAAPAAAALATELGVPTIDASPVFSECVVPDGDSTRLDTACIKAAGEGQNTQRLIAVALTDQSEIVAYSVRLSDGAPMRFAAARLGDTEDALGVATKKIAKELRGAFGEADLFGIAPMLCLAIGGLLLLLLDAFSRHGARKDFAAYFTSLVGGLAFILAYMAWDRGGFPYSHELFGGMFSADRFSLFFALLISLGVAIAAPLALGFFKGQQIERGEFYALLLFSASGMVSMAQSTDLFVTFIALEVMSLGIYVLVGFMRHEKQSAEGAMKYFLLGAFSSGFLIYGIALVYGITGTTQIDAIARAISQHDELLKNPILLVGAFLILGSFFFKIAAVPFHMWTPDAYQAAPSPVTGFMAFGVKAAAFAAMLRIFGVSFYEMKGVGFSAWLSAKEGEPSNLGWYAITALLAAITMLFGNIAALMQSNVKRLLAYSSIAHAGYMLLGLVAMTVEQGEQKIPDLEAGRGVLFYLLAYGFSSLLAFGALGALEKHGEDLTELDNLKGAARRYPGIGLAMSVAMLSFAGIPPTGGFFGKLILFRDVISAGQVGNDLLYLTILGMIASVIGVYYYLKVVVVMYMEDPSDAVTDEEDEVKRPGALYAGLIAAALIVLYIGTHPARYVSIADNAIRDMAHLPPAPAATTEPTSEK